MTLSTYALLSTLTFGLAACVVPSEQDGTATTGLRLSASPPSGECSKEECGPEPLLASQLCGDGSVAGPSCERNPKGACGWIITSCVPPAPGPAPSPAPDAGSPTPAPSPVPDPGPPTCDKAACGPAPLVASTRCSDGSIAGPTCTVDPRTNHCGWEVTQCPPAPACGPASCGPLPYGMPNQLCADGSIGGPVCKASANGACGWTIVACP
jgi:hypothetical protein